MSGQLIAHMARWWQRVHGTWPPAPLRWPADLDVDVEEPPAPIFRPPAHVDYRDRCLAGRR